MESDGDSFNDEGEEEGKRDDEVEGFNFNKLNELHPNDKEKLAEFKQHLLDQKNDMAPLKVWQLQDLSLQAAERILGSPKDKQLKALIDLSQNFPSHARSLSKLSVTKELKKEVKKNQETFMMSMNVQVQLFFVEKSFIVLILFLCYSRLMLPCSSMACTTTWITWTYSRLWIL